MSTHGSLGIGKGVYKPCGWVLDFAFQQIMNLAVTSSYPGISNNLMSIDTQSN
jgi:hypothetical protein